MRLHLSSDGAPIYQQIVDQIRYRIVSNQLSAGADLPTIRGLAESLQVNPNTVARAYRELEHEGLVEKRRTTGTFVSAAAAAQSAAQRQRLITPDVDKLLIQARGLGIEIDALTELLQTRHRQLNHPETTDAKQS